MTKLVPPVVIFVRPAMAGNVGALARVMSNFGLTELRLVGDGKAPESKDGAFRRMDWSMACKGRPQLEEAKWYPTLTDALEGVHLCLGTSGREDEFPKAYARPLVSPAEGFECVAQWQEQANSEEETFRWAIVLGNERDGLSTEENALCQKLIHINTVDQNPSINIAMAAGLLFYHWHLVNLGEARTKPYTETGAFLDPAEHRRMRYSETGRSQWADIRQLECFLDYVMTLLDAADFFKFPDREAIRARLRRWIQGTRIPLSELLYGFEVAYQLRCWGTGTFVDRNFLGKVKMPREEVKPLFSTESPEL